MGKRSVARAVEPLPKAAGFAVDQHAGRVIPRQKTVIEREMRPPAGQREIFVAGAAEREDRAHHVAAPGDLAHQLPVAIAQGYGAAHPVRRFLAGDPHPRPVAPGAAAVLRRCHSAGHRIVDPGGQDFAIPDQRDHHREERYVAGEIARAVDRIDQPHRIDAGETLERRLVPRHALLAHHGGTGQQIEQPRRQPGLGLEIGDRHQVAGRFLPDIGFGQMFEARQHKHRRRLANQRSYPVDSGRFHSARCRAAKRSRSAERIFTSRCAKASSSRRSSTSPCR
jgi:hypothetical protein